MRLNRHDEVCSCPSCDKPFYCKGYCRKHYEKYRMYGDPFREINIQGDGTHRIERRIKKTHDSTCWTWTGCVNGPTGYAPITVNGKQWLAHRYSYHVYKGEIPQGLHVMHICHNKLCVNPEHLQAGTPLENERQKMEAGRTARGSRNGWSKLNERDVKKIKRDRRMLQTVASQYRVSESAISRIRSGITWGHV